MPVVPTRGPPLLLTRRRLAAALAIMALAIVACSDSPAAEPTSSPRSLPTETASPTPSPTPTPRPSPTEAAEPPDIDLTADSEADFERVVQEILTYRDWLFAHPQKTRLISTIYMGACECRERLITGLDELAAAGQTIETSESRAEDVQVDNYEPDRGAARLIVTWYAGESEQLDASGQVVASSGGQEIEQIWLLLRENTDRPWRVIDLVERS